MMQYRVLEKNGDSLSVLGFGCMRLPQKGNKIDEKRATAQVRYAIDKGVNYIDTAVPYHMGASEPFLGRALSDGYREKVKLATKLPPWSVEKRIDMDNILDSQLKKLNTTYIDYYLVHSLDGKSWKKMDSLGVLDFLDSSKEKGTIINAGFSFHGRLDDFRKIIDSYDWDFCMIQYNILDEQNQAGTKGLEYAASKGIGVFVMEPLRGGNLSRNIPQGVQKIMDDSGENWSMAEWALRWVWDHPQVTLLLSGMNEEAHIEENIKIASNALPGSLTKDHVATIDKIKKEYRSLMKIDCTGCRYCLPCPANVNIPLCFELYNSKHMFVDSKVDTFDYAVGLGVANGVRGFASQCTNCGKCVSRCPQHLDIPALLPDVADEFEGLKLSVIIRLARVYLAFQRWRTRIGAGR